MSAAPFRSMIGCLCLLGGVLVAAGAALAALAFGIALPAGWVAMAVVIGAVGGLAIRYAVLRLLDANHRQQETERLRFHTAIENISQGLCFFDGARRLIVCNQRYAELYRLTPEQVRPGTTLEEIVEYRVAAGCFPQMSRDDYLAWRSRIVIADKPSDTVAALQDGRTIAIHHQPMPDGGWVATHADITDQCRAQAQIERLARLDPLSGMANRRIFVEHLETSLATQHDRLRPVAILCIDLDRFKNVNDTLGHPVGDLLIQAVASRLTEGIEGKHLAARLGGDEFAIVQTGVAQPESAVALAERLIASLSRPFHLDGHRLVIGASIGIALAPLEKSATAADDLLKAADLALYEVKSQGRGGYSLFRSELRTLAEARRGREHDLRVVSAN